MNSTTVLNTLSRLQVLLHAALHKWILILDLRLILVLSFLRHSLHDDHFKEGSLLSMLSANSFKALRGFRKVGSLRVTAHQPQVVVLVRLNRPINPLIQCFLSEISEFRRSSPAIPFRWTSKERPFTFFPPLSIARISQLLKLQFSSNDY